MNMRNSLTFSQTHLTLRVKTTNQDEHISFIWLNTLPEFDDFNDFDDFQLSLIN